MVTNPGAIPRNAIPAESASKRRVCLRCQCYKPPLAHHCSICNRCIVKMDHHCPWVRAPPVPAPRRPRLTAAAAAGQQLRGPVQPEALPALHLLRKRPLRLRARPHRHSILHLLHLLRLHPQRYGCVQGQPRVPAPVLETLRGSSRLTPSRHCRRQRRGHAAGDGDDAVRPLHRLHARRPAQQRLVRHHRCAEAAAYHDALSLTPALPRPILPHSPGIDRLKGREARGSSFLDNLRWGALPPALAAWR